jgi:UDP-glucose:(heptosyl)LPS alpha-1,3-glucosyltransferase
MRIGVVIDRFDPAKGGAERALALFVRHAEAAGHEVWTFALEFSADAPGRRMRVLVRSARRGPRDTQFVQRAVSSAIAVQCDVTIGVRHITGVDVYWPHGGVHAETLAAVERSKGSVAGAVSRALHDASPKQRALLGLERRFFADPGGARIWCVSDLVRREIVARWPDVAGNVELHPNGIDLDTFHPRVRDERRDAFRDAMGIPAATPMLLFLGGNWRLKGWPVLLSALQSLKRRDWVCVAAGDKHAAAIRAVKRAKLSTHVRVLPKCDARDLYAAADLLIQPTWRDPCSLATLEALACGVPVVTTDANGAAEALAGFAGAGEVVAAGDSIALSMAIAKRLTVAKSFDGDARRAAERRPQRAWLDALVASAATSSPASPKAG